MVVPRIVFLLFVKSEVTFSVFQAGKRTLKTFFFFFLPENSLYWLTQLSDHFFQSSRKLPQGSDGVKFCKSLVRYYLE